jgi:hypothetical protein
MRHVSLTDVGLFLGAVSSPFVAVFVARSGNHTARDIAQTTADTASKTAEVTAKLAKETADADREVERERIRAESEREHRQWISGQKRDTYMRVVGLLSQQLAYVNVLSLKDGPLRTQKLEAIDPKPLVAASLQAAEELAVFATWDMLETYLSLCYIVNNITDKERAEQEADHKQWTNKYRVFRRLLRADLGVDESPQEATDGP